MRNAGSQMAGAAARRRQCRPVLRCRHLVRLAAVAALVSGLAGNALAAAQFVPVRGTLIEEHG